jgi:apolipoprotein N-acyltransferase
MRSVEEGLPLVRVANTGISAIIDGYGRIIDRLPLGTRGVLDGPLPKPAKTATPYARYGNTAVVALSAILILVLSVYRRRLPLMRQSRRR